MFEHRSDQAHVELAQLPRQRVDVSVKDFSARAEQTMAKPVGILPTLDVDVVFVGPKVVVAVVKLVAERDEVLLARVAQAATGAA